MPARAAAKKTAKSGRSRAGVTSKPAVKVDGRRRARRAGPPHVALIVETSLAYGRGLLHGIGRYIRENGPWSVYVDQRSLYDPPPPWLKGWTGDGIISRASSPQIAKLIVDTGVPAVDLNEEVMGLGLPLIYNDHHMIGRLAAEHLMERGFTQFAFLGHDNLEWSNRRQAGFQRALAARDFSCDVFHFPGVWTPGRAPPRWEEEMDSLNGWLKKLPKPVGIMACNDFRAVQLIDACRRAQVAVPEQAA
ncbi:MAG: XylR family transcriptional regulator, partial [Phycisphaeraceae bacterium]